MERGTDCEGEIRAQLELLGHLRTAEVQVAVAQARVLGGLDAVLDLEGRGLGATEHLDTIGQNLNLAGGKLGVHRLGVARDNRAVHENGPLGTHGLGCVEGIARSVLRVEGALRHAGAIAQVAEDQTAVVAATPHPSGEGNLLTDVLGAKLAGGAGVHGMDVLGVLDAGCSGRSGYGAGWCASSGLGLCHRVLLIICAAPCRSGRRAYRLPSLRRPRSPACEGQWYQLPAPSASKPPDSYTVNDGAVASCAMHWRCAASYFGFISFRAMHTT